MLELQVFTGRPLLLGTQYKSGIIDYTSDMVLGDVPSSCFDFEMEHIAGLLKNDITTVNQ